MGPEGRRRNRFRGTAAHNTVTVDGRDQADTAGPFAWGPLPETQVLQWITGKSFDLFQGRHSGYERLSDPVTHERWIVRAGSCWLVRDVLLGRGAHEIGIHWHFDPGIVPVLTGNNAVVADETLALIGEEGGRWVYGVGTEEYSPAYGQFVPAAAATALAKVECPVETATAIVLGSGGILRKLQQGPVTVYEYSELTHRRLFVFAESGPWTFERWKSDGSFFSCVESPGGSVSEVILSSGTYISYDNSRVVESPVKAARFEGHKMASGWTFSSDVKDIRLSAEALSN